MEISNKITVLVKGQMKIVLDLQLDSIKGKILKGSKLTETFKTPARMLKSLTQKYIDDGYKVERAAIIDDPYTKQKEKSFCKYFK